MKELRCKKCNRLLAKHDGNIEVKCPRCKTMNSYQLTIKMLHDAKDKMFELGEYNLNRYPEEVQMDKREIGVKIPYKYYLAYRGDGYEFDTLKEVNEAVLKRVTSEYPNYQIMFGVVNVNKQKKIISRYIKWQKEYKI